MMRTLVLNSSYQPITTVSARRAAILLLDESAELVEGTGEYFRSPSTSVPVASVIRLLSQVRTPGRYRVNLSRKAILARDGGRCAYCNRPADSVDHVIPRSREGGCHAWTNVVAACRACNAHKGARTPEEAGMSLRRQPVEPRGIDALTLTLRGYQGSWSQWVRHGH